MKTLLAPATILRTSFWDLPQKEQITFSDSAREAPFAAGMDPPL